MGKIAIKAIGVLLVLFGLCRIDTYAYGLEYRILQNAPKRSMTLHTEWYDIAQIVYTSVEGRVCFDGKTYSYTPNGSTTKSECGIRLEGFTLSFEKVDSIVDALSTRTFSDSIRLSDNEMELLTFFVTIADLPRLMFPHYDRTRTDYKMPVSDIAVYLGRSTYSTPIIGKEQGRILKRWYSCNKRHITEKMWRQYLEYVFGCYPVRINGQNWFSDANAPILSCINSATYAIRLELLQDIATKYLANKI